MSSELSRAIEAVEKLPFKRESTREYLLKILGKRSRGTQEPKKTAKWKSALVPVPRLKKELDTVFSIFIRRRGADENGFGHCVTCGHIARWQDMDCGHYQPRQDLNTRWDERNCHLQCKACNGFRGGEAEKMAAYIDTKYGKGTADILKAKARMPLKLDRHKLTMWIANYKAMTGTAKPSESHPNPPNPNKGI